MPRDHFTPTPTIALARTKKTVLAFMMWCCITSLSDTIEVSFIRVGHTRRAVDGYFGLIKQKWRSTEHDTLQDVEEAVNQSYHASKPCLYSWQWYEWDAFLLRYFKPVKYVLKVQHFRVASTGHTTIECRETAESEPVLFKILHDGVEVPSDLKILPAELHPPGISDNRRKFLDENVVCYYFARDAQESLPWK